jgi:hypothetical protein
MEGFSFVTPVTGLNRPNTGKEDDFDEFYLYLPLLMVNNSVLQVFSHDILLCCPFPVTILSY